MIRGVPQERLPPAERGEPEVVVFGARCGKLTQFGSLWFDLDAIQAVDFAPADGCGFEITIAGKCQHFHNLGARDALRTFLIARAEQPLTLTQS